jgi:hypothetical protein
MKCHLTQARAIHSERKLKISVQKSLGKNKSNVYLS